MPFVIKFQKYLFIPTNSTNVIHVCVCVCVCEGQNLEILTAIVIIIVISVYIRPTAGHRLSLRMCAKLLIRNLPHTVKFLRHHYESIIHKYKYLTTELV